MIKEFVFSKASLSRIVIASVMATGIGIAGVNGSLAQQPVSSETAPLSVQTTQTSQAGSAVSPIASVQSTEAGQAPIAQSSSQEEQTASSASAPEAMVSYGLSDLWSQGDVVARLTLIIMAVMSVGSWYVIVMKVIGQMRVAKAAKEVKQRQFWQQSTLRRGVDTLNIRSAYRYLAENGIDSVVHYQGGLQENVDLYSWVSMALHRALDNLQEKLQSGLAFLGTVGSTAPFVGLFGTVWGIHHALSAISVAGQATLDKVAGPVGEALIMTAIGLATAVPAVLGYNYLVRRNKVLMGQARHFASDVQTVLLGGNKAEVNNRGN